MVQSKGHQSQPSPSVCIKHHTWFTSEMRKRFVAMAAKSSKRSTQPPEGYVIVSFMQVFPILLDPYLSKASHVICCTLQGCQAMVLDGATVYLIYNHTMDVVVVLYITVQYWKQMCLIFTLCNLHQTCNDVTFSLAIAIFESL